MRRQNRPRSASPSRSAAWIPRILPAGSSAPESVAPRLSVFIPFHFAEAAANLLTNDALDPLALIPEFKACAVNLAPARVELPQFAHRGRN